MPSKKEGDEMRRRWSKRDEKYLLEYRYRFGRPWDYLAIELGRSVVAVQSKYYLLLRGYEDMVMALYEATKQEEATR